MAKKTNKSAENIAALTASALCPGKETAAAAVETTPATTPTAKQPRPKRANLIVSQHKFNRWYVYFKGVAPKDIVGCGCKAAKSGIRYFAPAQSPLRIYHIPEHLRTPPVRGSGYVVIKFLRRSLYFSVLWFGYFSGPGLWKSGLCFYVLLHISKKEAAPILTQPPYCN